MDYFNIQALPVSQAAAYLCAVKRILLILLLSMPVLVNAQSIYAGFVYDSSSRAPLASVRVENNDTHLGVLSGANGYFEIAAEPGQALVISLVGYKNSYVQVVKGDAGTTHNIYLRSRAVQLKEVTIHKGPTEYQEDSARRASIYKDAFEYEQTKSVFSPVSSIYQKFSKKHRDMRKFQEQIENLEDEKYIDSRYTLQTVMAMTQLDEEAARKFMRAYPMEADYARAASDLEIKMWIRYNFLEYKKKK